MKAVLCKAYGPPEDLIIEDIAAPEPGPDEVVVEAKAIGLNFFDTLIIQDKYQFKPDLPFSPAAELAGIVKSVGSNVTGYAQGDRVMAYTKHGAAREEVAVPASQVVPVPEGLDLAIAAGLTVTYGTSYHALKDRADLKPGETLAVLGASGGVGQSAIEIGKAMGARVIACASSQDKLDFCREVGADNVINYAEEDLKDRLKDLTDGKGADVVYDPVGGDLAEAAVRATAWDGRFLVIGFAAGEIPKIPLNLVLLKGCALVGVFWGAFVARHPDRHLTNMTTLLNWCVNGEIKPHIHDRIPLEGTPAALRAFLNREVKGKIVIEP
ncbi:MAG: NADPH:quinone oxidoreductase family protein [Hyphomicrobiales bacterium]